MGGCELSAGHFLLMPRVGHNHTLIGIYGVHTIFLAGKSPYIRSYTVQICDSGQPYLCLLHLVRLRGWKSWFNCLCVGPMTVCTYRYLQKPRTFTHTHAQSVCLNCPLYVPLRVLIEFPLCMPTQYMSRVGQNRIYAPYMTAYLVISLPKTPYIVYTPYIYGSGQPYICPSCYPLHTTTQIYVHTVRLTQYMYNYCVYIHCVVHTAYVHTLHAYLLCVCPLCCPTAYVHTVCVNMEDVYIHCVFHCICPRSVCPHTTCIFTYLLCVCPLCCPTACVHTVCVNIEDVCPLCCPRSVCPHSMREH